MDRLTVACVQQRMRVPATLDEYRDYLRRFLRVAQNRNAELVLFPELGGTMAATSILDDLRSNLLKRADRGGRREAGFWQRIVGRLSTTLAGYLRADLRRSMAALLDASSASAWDAYADLYGGLAKEHSLILIAPSAYLPDPLDGVIRNLAAVFGNSGEFLGTQAKVVLHPSDADLARPGTAWDVIQTDVGRIGLILGGDVLYPEVGRLLAYQGADILAAQAACLDMAMYQKVRAGVLARMQDNQLFAAASFLVGPDVLGMGSAATYAGRSAIFAPQELTPRLNGVLVEMGGARSEGVVAAEWDFAALRDLWESSDTPIRRTLTSVEVANAMGEIYARLQQPPALPQRTLIAPSVEIAPESHHGELATLDDLQVVDSYRQDWPPESSERDFADLADTGQWPDQSAGTDCAVDDDETDEYDSVTKSAE